jgi:tetratricopeptide (TPR) repeat protein
MKINFSIFFFTFLLISCHQKTFQEHIDNVRDEFSNQSKTQNERILSWERTVNSIEIIADTNHILAINYIDSLIQFDTTLNMSKLYDLHFIKGNIYYNNDNLKKAIDEFSLSAQNAHFDDPKTLAAKAGAYIKLREFDTALNKLNQAAELNYSYYWNIGNYYEIVGQKDSAINNYERLYKYDTSFYKYCKDRITELNKNKPQFLNELIYKDRERRVLLLHGVN